MAKTHPIYSDRDYLEARFSSTDEKLDKIIDIMEKQEARITSQDEEIREINQQLYGTKLLGKAAISVAVMLGGVVTWALNISEKVFPHINR